MHQMQPNDVLRPIVHYYILYNDKISFFTLASLYTPTVTRSSSARAVRRDHQPGAKRPPRKKKRLPLQIILIISNPI